MKYSDFMDVGDISTPSTEPYIRPSEWPDMPELIDTDKKFCAVVQVFDTDSEFVALKFDGDFSIDWGDGNSGTQADNNGSGVIEHQYDFANCTSTAYGYNVALIQVTGTGSWTFIDTTIKHTNIARNQSNESTPFLDISIAGQSLTSVSLYNISGNNNQNRKLQVFSMRDNAITTMTSMFYYCTSLTSIPLLDTSSVTNIYYMFYNCSSLTSIPLLDTSSVTNMYYMFYNCNSLISIPLLDTSSVTDMSYMLYNCSSMTSIPLLDTSSVTNISQMFRNCYSLTKGALSGTVTSISYVNCRLSATELNDIFTNLGTVTSKTITITGNWGADTCDQTIATNKGWTVTN